MDCEKSVCGVLVGLTALGPSGVGLSDAGIAPSLRRTWHERNGGKSLGRLPKREEAAMTDTVKYLLDEARMPRAWYNLAADLPKPLAPVLHPGTGQPICPQDLAPLFPMEV